MKWSFSGRSMGGVAWIAAPLAAVALSGCYTSRTAIRGGDLPRVIFSAARNPREEVRAVDETGEPVVTSGRLDVVTVLQPGPAIGEDRFEAPVLARFDDTWLTVWNKGKLRSYQPSQIGRIVVQRYDTVGASKAGVLLTVFGGLTMVVGGVLIGLIPAAHDGLPYYGIPVMSAGIGLVVGGIPLLVAANRAPAAVISAGPGGIQLRF
jgi:hypothetical protein